METITLALLLLAAVLLSSIIDQLVPRISLPLVQIVIGIIIAVGAGSAVHIELDPEIFLVLFIAPLLFDEAKNADKAKLWRDRKPILSLAIGLVVATTLIIGFSVHAIIPSIPLAAAFALGAALGPTDAVAVSSLSKQIDIPERQKSLLKGELLLNDASGIVSFQFALAACITGTFSLMGASVNFLVEFVGGLLFGAAFGLAANWIVRKARDIGVENTTFHVLFEVFTPLIVYLAAQAFHVSGIIAVVVAGLMNVISPRAIGPSIARMNIVSSSVWRVVSFALNGIVFVLLGTQLPTAMRHTWDDISINNVTLIGCMVALTALLLLIRFVWVMCMERVHVRSRTEDPHLRRSDVREALITTLCGAKGTITLSILFTIPVYMSYTPLVRFPQRELIIFLACGVIVCTLLIATFVVPLIAPKASKERAEVEQQARDVDTMIQIMRDVIENLTAHMTRENRRATQIVIKSYNDRIARIKETNGIEEEDDDNVELRVQVLELEQERVLELVEEDKVSGLVGYQYLARLERIERLLKHGKGRFSPARLMMRLRVLFRRGLFSVTQKLPDSGVTAQAEEMRMLQIEAETYAIGYLEAMTANPDADTPTEDAAALLLEYQRSVAMLRSSMPSVTSTIRAADRTEDIKRFAYACELKQIQEAYEEERLSRPAARYMRENVFLMQLDLNDAI